MLANGIHYGLFGRIMLPTSNVDYKELLSFMSDRNQVFTMVKAHIGHPNQDLAIEEAVGWYASREDSVAHLSWLAHYEESFLKGLVKYGNLPGWKSIINADISAAKMQIFERFIELEAYQNNLEPKEVPKSFLVQGYHRLSSWLFGRNPDPIDYRAFTFSAMESATFSRHVAIVDRISEIAGNRLLTKEDWQKLYLIAETIQSVSLIDFFKNKLGPEDLPILPKIHPELENPPGNIEEPIQWPKEHAKSRN